MPKFVIERQVSGVGRSSTAELQSMARKSCDVLRVMGPDIQWLHSYVTGDKIYCIYIADDEAKIREHARKAGFPADSVSRITAVIDPTTAEQFSTTRT
jgi:hypothetical protein